MQGLFHKNIRSIRSNKWFIALFIVASAQGLSGNTRFIVSSGISFYLEELEFLKKEYSQKMI